MQNKTELTDTITLIDESIREVGLDYAIIGGVAVILRGYERSTQDVDAVVLEADTHLSALISAFMRNGLEFRIAEGEEFARKNRVMLLKGPDGTSADISMGALPFEYEMIQRSTQEQVFESLYAPVATVEDLVIMKLIANRPQDIDDVRRLLEIHTIVDKNRIRLIVTEYLQILEAPDILERLTLLD